MTWRSRLLWLSPTLWLLAVGGSAVCLLARPSAAAVGLLLAAVYLVPVLSYRLHNVLFPLKEGASHLVGDAYSSWWGGHQLQLPFVALPALEMPLKMVPGLFSLWLRCWGSRIGKGVYWTPWVEVVDRGMLDVGDGVVFGHRVGIYGHLIKPTRTNLLLFAKRVTVGDGAFVGAGAVLLPGCVIEAGAVVPMKTELAVNAFFPSTASQEPSS